MGFRTVVITKQCKLSYKNEHLIVRGDVPKMIHLSDISNIIIDNTQVSVTTYLLSQLISHKIKIMFCDEKRNPIGELIPFYGSHNTSKKVIDQSGWKENFKQQVWTHIVSNKIDNQALFLQKLNKDEYLKLKSYIDEMEFFDSSNREGHAAKVYFNSLFGVEFSRDSENSINAGLDYGYSILLSAFNREICNLGYITQLGIRHKNQFNQFNLSCDLMEPFRVIIDEIVYENLESDFDKEFKLKLVDSLNKQIFIAGKQQYLNNAINVYVKSVLDCLDRENIEILKYYNFV